MIIYRYLIKEWLRFFIITLAILFLLLSTGNLIGGLLRSDVTPLETILNHLLETPKNMRLLFPISCLVASLFCINKIKAQNELVAIFASGYSQKNLVLSFVSISFFIALVQFFIVSYVDPIVKSKHYFVIKDGYSKFKNLKEQGLKTSTITSGKIWYKSKKYFLSFSTFDEKKKTIHRASFYYFTKNNKISKKVEALSLTHIEKKRWIATDLLTYDFLDIPRFPKVSYFKNKNVMIDESYEDFKQIKSDITTLTPVPLYQYIKKLESTGINPNEYKIIFLEKFSSSLLSIILTVLATITSFNPNRRSRSFGKNLAFVSAFTVLYWLSNTYLIEMGKNSKIQPWTACFAPLLFFMMCIGICFHKNRTLTNWRQFAGRFFHRQP